jgi:hypothetical protein
LDVFRDFQKSKSPNIKIVLLGGGSLHPTYRGIIYLDVFKAISGKQTLN